MAYINSTRTVVNNVGTDIALAGAGNLFTVSGSLGGTKSLTLSDGFINNGAPEANLIVPLLFPNGHNDLGPSLYLEITVAGVTNPIPVVSNQNGTLLPIPHHEMTEGGSTVYKVIDPNTILNVYYTADYDGNGTPAFVVVGNPLVLSSSTYSIYANGKFELLKITTDEQWTGRYWKNGKKIYTKIVESPSQGTTIATSVDEVISYVAKRRWSANDSRSVFYDGNAGYNSILIDETSGNVSFAKSEASYNTTIHFIILEYTKTTD